MKNSDLTTDKKQQSLQLIFEQGILPLFYHASEEKSTKILQALYEAGIRTVEYTNRGEAALKNFKVLRKHQNRR
jgi:2-dehydro-3-deoxyphosphogluconate aldolase / (4S)-4-hydroxy-2-oxoglutarate aldolase